MTCRQLGGPCDHPLTGQTADELMNNGTAHVNEMAAQGDEPHKMVLDQMNKIGKDPEATQAWLDKFNSDFNATPDTV